MKRGVFLSTGLAAAALAPRAARAQLRGFQQRLTIGINAPLSGNAQDAGAQLVTGVQTAIDFANQFTPMVTSAFALRLFDTAGDFAQLVNNVQFAAGDPSVVALITVGEAAAIERALPAYANAQMPLVLPASTADSLTARGYRLVWRLPTRDTLEGQMFARFIASRARPKFGLAVSQTGVYGGDVMNGFTAAARGAKFKADGYFFPSDRPNYRAAAKTIVGLGPDLVYLCGSVGNLGPLIPALHDAGYTGKLSACEAFYDGATLKDYAGALDGGFISTSFPPLDRNLNASQELMNLRTRANISILTAFAYASAQVVMSAVRRTGATNRLATMSSLQSPSTYNTILGQFYFAPTGDPVDPNLYFYTIDRGAFRFAASSHPGVFL